MSEKTKNIALSCLMAALLLCLSLWSLLREADEYSLSERRLLASMPELSGESLISSSFMEDFESFTQDQFPLRDGFRRLKALSSRYLLGRLDNNGLFFHEGHLSKLDYPLNDKMLQHASGRFNAVYEQYLKNSGSKLYLSIIPDKNYFLCADEAFPCIDYDALVQTVREDLSWAEYIDIFPLLSLDDYYRTDSHWQQTHITPVATKLLESMGAFAGEADYTEVSLPLPFYGVYHGQAALPVGPDTLSYMESAALSTCTVTDYDSGKAVPGQVYDLEAAAGRDGYEMFLCGSSALVTLENPSAETDRELIIFRDSFAGSLAPLMAHSYSKITLVDLRYINSAFLGNFVDFENCDVLFLYSSMLLNNSMGIK